MIRHKSKYTIQYTINYSHNSCFFKEYLSSEIFTIILKYNNIPICVLKYITLLYYIFSLRIAW